MKACVLDVHVPPSPTSSPFPYKIHRTPCRMSASLCVYHLPRSADGSGAEAQRQAQPAHPPQGRHGHQRPPRARLQGRAGEPRAGRRPCFCGCAVVCARVCSETPITHSSATSHHTPARHFTHAPCAPRALPVRSGLATLLVYFARTSKRTPSPAHRHALLRHLPPHAANSASTLSHCTPHAASRHLTHARPPAAPPPAPHSPAPQLHSKPRSEQHVSVGNRTREWTGNVTMVCETYS